MIALAETIAATGAEQVAVTALHALFWVLAVTGGMFLALAACGWLRWRNPLREVLAEAEAGDDLPEWLNPQKGGDRG